MERPKRSFRTPKPIGASSISQADASEGSRQGLEDVKKVRAHPARKALESFRRAVPYLVRLADRGLRDMEAICDFVKLIFQNRLQPGSTNFQKRLIVRRNIPNAGRSFPQAKNLVIYFSARSQTLTESSMPSINVNLRERPSHPTLCTRSAFKRLNQFATPASRRSNTATLRAPQRTALAPTRSGGSASP